jgi:hypothetical protein
VTFYLLRQTGGDPTQHDKEVDRVEWFPLDYAVEHATYAQEREVLKKAKELIFRS